MNENFSINHARQKSIVLRISRYSIHLEYDR